MKKLIRGIKNLYDKQIDGHGLAVFRIVYSLVLLGEIIHLFYYRHLIFDKIPYLVPGEIDLAPALLFWMLSVVAIIIGFKTRIVTIINYILTVVVIGTTSTFEYHMFYAYLGINFLLIFMPISRCLSIDRLFLKLKYSNTRFRYSPPVTVSALNYFIPVFVGIALVYFDSIFHKFASDFWTRGLGVWLPSVMPQTVFIDTSALMNIKWLVIFLGYLTVVFEATFIFLFWRKRWRVICGIIGIGLHIGILISYPIPFFALGVTSIYLLLIPVSFWKKLFNTTKKTSARKVTFYYDGECPLCNRTRIILEHFDTRNKIQFTTAQVGKLQDEVLKDIPLDTLLDDIHSVNRKGNVYSGVDTYIQVLNAIWYLKPVSWILRMPGLYHISKRIYRYISRNRVTERCTEDNCGYVIPTLPAKDETLKILKNYTLADLKRSAVIVGIGCIVIFQSMAIYISPLMKNIKENLGISNSTIIRKTNTLASIVTDFTKDYFGITVHGVFMDAHFYQYNHSIAVVYKNDNKEVWLPLTNQSGTPGNYLIGHNWVKYTFRVNAPHVNQENLIIGLRDFTAFWAHKNGINLDNATFEIRVKKNEQPTEWEKDFLHKQLANPWIPAGTIEWKNKEFNANIAVIEDL